MAVAPQTSGPGRLPNPLWPSQEELELLAPVMRLMATISAIPQVTKMGISRGQAHVDLWVFMASDDYDAEALISRAEHDFLTSGCPPVVLVHVVPGTDIDRANLPPTTVLFER